MRLFIFALSLAVVAAASEKTSPRGGRAFPSPKNRVAMDSSASHEYDGVLSSLFRMGHGQNDERSGMNMMANPDGKTHSAVKESSPFEKSLPSFRSSCCSTVEVRPHSSYSEVSVQPQSYGYYYKQELNINGKVWYKKNQYDKCIWWSTLHGGAWYVGRCSVRGSDYGHFVNYDDYDCPQDPGWSWQYSNSGWYDANYQMSIYCA